MERARVLLQTMSQVKDQPLDIVPDRNAICTIRAILRCFKHKIDDTSRDLAMQEERLLAENTLGETWKRKYDYLSHMFLCKSCQLKLESLTLGDPILVCAECIQRQKTCRILEHRQTHLQDLLVAAEKDRDLWRKRYNILYEEYKPLYEEYLNLKADPEGLEEIISKNERHDDGSHGGI